MTRSKLTLVGLLLGIAALAWYLATPPQKVAQFDGTPPTTPEEVESLPDGAGFGYNPDPEATKEFLQAFPGGRSALSEQAPQLFEVTAQDEAVLLYRALNIAYEQRYPGSKWIVEKQGIGDCFPGETMVLMADGTERPIKDVRVGDYVMSHIGAPRRVVDTFAKSYTGDMVTINAKGYSVPITATADHRFVTYPGIAFGKGSGNHKPDATPAWRPIGELNVGDRVLLSRYWSVGVPQQIELRDGRYVDLDEDLGYLIGLYLAEGGLSKYPNGLANRIDLSLGRHETDLVERSSFLFESKFGRVTTCNLPSKPSVTMVRCGDVTAAQAFQSIIPGNVYTKEVPSVVFASPRRVRMAVIRGWLAGDGHEKLSQYKGGYSLQAQGTSASIPLLRSMHRLAMSCDLKPSLRMRKQYENRAPSGDLFFYGQSVLALFPDMREAAEKAMAVRGLRAKYRDVVDDGLASPIETIERKAVVNETVHCIEVEHDHSFVANGYGVHNCVSHGWKHGVDIHLAVLKLSGEVSEWKPAATEAIYGGSRVEARGRRSGGWSDGSYGSAAAKFVRDWGVVFREDYTSRAGSETDLTKYSPRKAKDWGNYGCGGRDDQGRLDAICKEHPIKNVALVTTWEETKAALRNGYPIPVCSGQGFASRTDRDGFAAARGSWAHCMCAIGFRTDREGVLILNSWGPNWIDQSGGRWPDDMPRGAFWCERSTWERMLRGRDSFAVAGAGGFKKRQLKNAAGW